jgi:hypothetical protein
MTPLEWYAFVGIPIILIFAGFLAERLHAHQFKTDSRSFLKTFIDGRPLQAIVPAGLIGFIAIVMNRIFS